MFKIATAAIVFAALATAADAAENAYTLYRGSVAPDVFRVHVATFDAANGEKYNRENCAIAAGLFQRQPGVTVPYWCEWGRYKPRAGSHTP